MSSPRIHMIGNAHLDPGWMWKIEEGMEAFLSTCHSAIDRIRETSEFIFTCSSAAHYEFVEQVDPVLFREIQQAVANGSWAIVGGWWVEADCNAPSGEGFIRQALLGQQYFLSRFGRSCAVGYCIDSFGHNVSLPQLLKHCGMNGYVFMRPEEHEKHLDQSYFLWKGIDGTAVKTYRIPLHYSTFARNVQEKLRDLPAYPLYDPSTDWMLFYGVGNHGGGPTKEQINQIQKIAAVQQNVLFSDPVHFFESVAPTALYEGELQPHAIGCYAAHSQIKKLSRLAEYRLLRAEKIIAFSQLLTSNAVQNFDLTLAWKNVCFNHFHDTLGGVSIKETCDQAIHQYYEALAIAERSERIALQRISRAIDTSNSIESLIIYNFSGEGGIHPFEFELWHPSASEKGEILSSVALRTNSGEEIPVQKVEPSGKIGEDRVRCTGTIALPPYGWQRLTLQRQQEEEPVHPTTLRVSSAELSNGVIRMAFNGEQTEVACTYQSAIVYRDDSDTWGHGISGYSGVEGTFQITKIDVIEEGPIRGRVRVTSTYRNSWMEEDFILYHDQYYIEQRVRLNWQEKHRVVKLQYPHSFDQPEVFYEIPYGVIERPIQREVEYPGQRWIAARDRKTNKGLAIITDTKYSYSADSNSLSVTVARSPLYAHHVPPHEIKPRETLQYLDQGIQEFTNWIVPMQEDFSLVTINSLANRLTEPVIAKYESSHDGALPSRKELIRCESNTVKLSVIKQGSVNKESMILRLVECAGIESNADIVSDCLNLHYECTLHPFEIKTFQVLNGIVTEVNGIEQ